MRPWFFYSTGDLVFGESVDIFLFHRRFFQGERTACGLSVRLARFFTRINERIRRPRDYFRGRQDDTEAFVPAAVAVASRNLTFFCVSWRGIHGEFFKTTFSPCFRIVVIAQRDGLNDGVHSPTLQKMCFQYPKTANRIAYFARSGNG